MYNQIRYNTSKLHPRPLVLTSRNFHRNVEYPKNIPWPKSQWLTRMTWTQYTGGSQRDGVPSHVQLEILQLQSKLQTLSNVRPLPVFSLLCSCWILWCNSPIKWVCIDMSVLVQIHLPLDQSCFSGTRFLNRNSRGDALPIQLCLYLRLTASCLTWLSKVWGPRDYLVAYHATLRRAVNATTLVKNFMSNYDNLAGMAHDMQTNR